MLRRKTGEGGCAKLWGGGSSIKLGKVTVVVVREDEPKPLHTAIR